LWKNCSIDNIEVNEHLHSSGDDVNGPQSLTYMAIKRPLTGMLVWCGRPTVTQCTPTHV